MFIFSLLQNVFCICINCIRIVAATMHNRPLERPFLFLSVFSHLLLLLYLSSPFDGKQCDEERTATTRRKFIIWNRGILTSYLFLCVRHARRALTNLILIIFCDQIVFLFLASFFSSLYSMLCIHLNSLYNIYFFSLLLIFIFNFGFASCFRCFFSSLPIQFTAIAQPQANLVNLVSLVSLSLSLFVCVSYFQFWLAKRLVVQSRLNLVTNAVCILCYATCWKIKSIFNCVSPSKYLRSMYSSVKSFAMLDHGLFESLLPMPLRTT